MFISVYLIFNILSTSCHFKYSWARKMAQQIKVLAMQNMTT